MQHKLICALLAGHHCTFAKYVCVTVAFCNTLRHITKHYNTPQRKSICAKLAGPCIIASVLTICVSLQYIHFNILQLITTHCNTLQHTATHCNTLQSTATHRNPLQLTAIVRRASPIATGKKRHQHLYITAMQHTAPHNSLPTATHCTPLQQCTGEAL